MLRLYFRGLYLPVVIISLFILPQPMVTPSIADIYQYIDERGVIHFTNTPKGNKYKKIISEGPKKTLHSKANGPQVITDPTYYEDIISRKSRKYNLDPSLIRAVITAESNWQPTAVSDKGAMGLMQLMPSTVKDMDVKNPFDPEENIEGGTKYLRLLLDVFDGDLTLALAAYNAGPEAVRKFGGVPPIAETRQYIKRVFSIYKGSTRGAGRSSIYKVILEDGSVLFTNTPAFYRKYNPSKF